MIFIPFTGSKAATRMAYQYFSFMAGQEQAQPKCTAVFLTLTITGLLFLISAAQDDQPPLAALKTIH
jgi:hypothetical protein